MRYRERIAEAKRRGKDAGKSAATWTRDGNTSDETVRRVRQGFADGDPAVYDMFRCPDLSGEYAGESMGEIIGDLLQDDDADDDVANAYNDAASEAFWPAVEKEYSK